jgi:hypothetical protein
MNRICIGLVYGDDDSGDVEIDMTEEFLKRPIREQEVALFRLQASAFEMHADALGTLIGAVDEELAALKVAIRSLAA